MKKLNNYLLIIFSTILLLSCSKSNEIQLSSDNNIDNFIVEGYDYNFNKETNKITIKTEPSSNQTTFKYKIIGLAAKAKTSIELEGEINISQNSYFNIYAENGNVRKIELEVIKKDGITDVKITSSQGGNVSNQIEIKDNKINIIVDKDLIQLFYPLASYKFLFNTTPGSYVEEMTNDIVGVDSPFTITFVSKNGTKKQYTVAFKNYNAAIEYIAMPSVSFKTNNNYFGPISTLKLNSRSNISIPNKYTQGLNQQDHILITLETEQEAFKNINPLTLRTSYKGTFFPDLSQKRDFTKDVIYKVTSESGKETEIKIRTFFEKFLTNLPIQYISIENDGSIAFYYYAVSRIKKLKLINTVKTEEVNTTILSHSILNETDLYAIRLQVDKSLISNDVYDIELTLENNDIVSKPIQQLRVR